MCLSIAIASVSCNEARVDQYFVWQAVSAMAEAHKLKLRQKFVKPTAAGYNKKPPVEKVRKFQSVYLV